MRTTLLTAATMLAAASSAGAESARVQIIHDAADPAAAVVDIWAGSERLVDDLAFRNATPFRDVPAGVEITIGVAPATSASAEEAIATFPVTFEAGRRYHVVAGGVLEPGDVQANPDGVDTGFTLRVDDRARESARFPWFVDLRAVHGVTDAPAVDVVLKGRFFGPLFDDVTYGDITGYETTLARELELEVTTADGSVLVGTYGVDVSGLRGGAAVVFASGFLTPDDVPGGAPFALLAALPDGTVLELDPLASTARMQIVHNAPDPGAALVDIYVDGELRADDLAFRSATPFVDVPAERPVTVAIAPPSSASADDAIRTFDVQLERDETYVAMAAGVLDPSTFEDNPDGREIAFAVLARDGARERAWWGRRVVLLAFHGATDAPAVDVTLRRPWFQRSFDALAYGDFQGYRSLPALRYRLDVSEAGADEALVSYDADLRELGGGAAVVFASGFLTPADDGAGAPFGIFAALPDGQVVPLPLWDPALEMPDVELLATNGSGARYQLAQNAPNPFNPITRISFELPAASPVRLALFNVRGERVRELLNDRMGAGFHTVTLDAAELPSGVYYYRIEAGTFSATRRMTLLK